MVLEGNAPGKDTAGTLTAGHHPLIEHGVVPIVDSPHSRIILHILFGDEVRKERGFAGGGLVVRGIRTAKLDADSVHPSGLPSLGLWGLVNPTIPTVQESRRLAKTSKRIGGFRGVTHPGCFPGGAFHEVGERIDEGRWKKLQLIATKEDVFVFDSDEVSKTNVLPPLPAGYADDSIAEIPSLRGFAFVIVNDSLFALDQVAAQPRVKSLGLLMEFLYLTPNTVFQAFPSGRAEDDR